MTHAEMAEALRALLAADPLPAPRVIYAAPDGRHTLSRPAEKDAASQLGVVAAAGTRQAGGGAR